MDVNEVVKYCENSKEKIEGGGPEDPVGWGSGGSGWGSRWM